MITKCIGSILWKIDNVIKKLERYYLKSKFSKAGENFKYGGGFFTYENIECGDNVYIGDEAYFLSSNAKIIIGNNVTIGPRVMIVTGDHRIDVVGKYINEIHEKLNRNDNDVVISDDVWIGMNVLILKGVTIGTGSVIGAGSVVTKNVEPYTIYVGNKSTMQYQRFSDEQLEMHLELIKSRNEGNKKYD